MLGYYYQSLQFYNMRALGNRCFISVGVIPRLWYEIYGYGV